MTVINKLCCRCKTVAEFRVYNERVSPYCVSCRKEYRKEHRNSNKEKYAEKEKSWYKKHNETRKARYAVDEEYRAKVAKTRREWRYRNLEKADLAVKEWVKHNPIRAAVIRTVKSRKRQTAKIHRYPSWLSEDHKAVIVAIYQTAKQMSVDTGTRYEVDHIYPLQGKLVSGLHVPFNLRIVTKTTNARKSNTYVPS